MCCFIFLNSVIKGLCKRFLKSVWTESFFSHHCSLSCAQNLLKAACHQERKIATVAKRLEKYLKTLIGKKQCRKWKNNALCHVPLSKRCPWARHLNVRRLSDANSSKLWLYWSAPRCEQGAVDQEQASSVQNNSSAGGLYAVYESGPSCQSVTDASQSKCRVERNQALEQARRPLESMFIPECNEDGTFAQVCLATSTDAFYSSSFSYFHSLFHFPSGPCEPSSWHHSRDQFHFIKIFDCSHIFLYLHSNILSKSCILQSYCFWCDLPFFLCRSSAILWQVTAGVSPVTASQWVAPLCTTGPRCVQVLGGNQPGSLWTKCWNEFQKNLRMLNWCARLCQHSFHLSCLSTLHISD